VAGHILANRGFALGSEPPGLPPAGEIIVKL